MLMYIYLKPKPNNATTEQILDQVAKCPSGALSIKGQEIDSEE
ncbi:(4Fe-4S)-binding protein [Weeksellaceae bacterium KMM 9724]|nr:(4Fe-4S)-binding protein [Profundicola chukchiensis]